MDVKPAMAKVLLGTYGFYNQVHDKSGFQILPECDKQESFVTNPPTRKDYYCICRYSKMYHII